MEKFINEYHTQKILEEKCYKEIDYIKELIKEIEKPYHIADKSTLRKKNLYKNKKLLIKIDETKRNLSVLFNK
jgi:hypothetical protein